MWLYDVVGYEGDGSAHNSAIPWNTPRFFTANYLDPNDPVSGAAS